MTTTDRFIVTTRRGEPAVRTNSMDEAKQYLERLGGQIIDLTAAAE